jgi:hypothetical protein
VKRWAGILVGLVVALAAAAPAAHAGTYTIYACNAGGKNWDNRSFAIEGGVPAGVATDVACAPTGDSIGLSLSAGARLGGGAFARNMFRPAPGTTISDFRINRRIHFNSPAVEGAGRPYVLLGIGRPSGSIPAEGAGEHSAAGPLGSAGLWYGNPSSRSGIITFAGVKAPADANAVFVQVGCRSAATPCQLGPGGRVEYSIIGAAITVTDNSVPRATVAASGLFAGGQRHGSDLVTLSASDNSGIRRVELVDVTDPAAPAVVGFEEYDHARPPATTTRTGATCSWRLRVPCPDLDGETLRPTSLQTGHRSLVVRVYDAAGNPTERGPYPVNVVTPSDRGPVNGAPSVRVSALLKGGRTRRTMRQGKRFSVRGRVVTPEGAPVAGAELRIRTRDTHREVYVDRGAVTTGADGRFAWRGRARASRLIQVGWRERMNDTRFAESAYVGVRAKARASLRGPRRVAIGRRFTLRGKLRGVKPGEPVAVVAQGRPAGGRYSTFALGHAKGKRFKLRYRFRNPSSRGRTFQIRVRLLPRGNWPYEPGRTRAVRLRVG